MANQTQKHGNTTNTIFLTEQESVRIRNTTKETLKKCFEYGGHAREPRDSKTAISQATGASLMADMNMTQTKQKDTLPALAVGQPYPPCTLLLRELKPMKLAHLKMATHHRGRRLAIKRASPVVTLAARSWTMVQDEEGDDTERLELCLHKLRHGEEILESASIFVIKGPYFTFTDQGEATLRIDHPSDLIVLRNATHNSDIISASDADTAASAEKLARMWKDRGNAALKQLDLPLAHANYTEGLKIAEQIVFNTNPDLARDISRNRAHVNLLLNRFDDAISDAQASFIGKEDQRSKELDSKACFRAGSAAYNLGEYHEARTFFEKQRKLMPEDKSASINLRRIEVRLCEQETGTYNWRKIRAGLSRARPRVDASSFVGKTKVGDSPGRGHGMFATCNIPAGDIVMCDKAFSVVWGHEGEALTAMTYDVRDSRIRASPVGLSKSTVEKLLNNPSQIERIMKLYGDYQGDGENVFQTEDGPVVDTFRVHDIVSRNAFSPGSQYGEEDARNASTGLWIWAAYINHSCVPNLRKEFVGDLMVLRAIRPITAGEEIFNSYDASSDYDVRKTALLTTWGFECDCALCAAAKADDPLVRKKRLELANEADAFLGKENWANAKRLTIAKAQRLSRAIDETYDAERYRNVPRISVQGIQDWLTKASRRR